MSVYICTCYCGHIHSDDGSCFGLVDACKICGVQDMWCVSIECLYMYTCTCYSGHIHSDNGSCFGLVDAFNHAFVYTWNAYTQENDNRIAIGIDIQPLCP
jgi:hypothetical protein